MKAVRLAVVLGVVVAVLLPAGPAGANVGLSASLSMPSGVVVGQTGLNGSFTVTNTNTTPQQSESNTLTELRLVLSCGTTSTAANLCSAPDVGVFSIGSTATGATGTACQGRTFSVSAPDASGAVTFTPQGGAVVLPPPGGAAGSNQCTVNFTLNVVRAPSIDADPAAAGIQTRANLVVTAQSSPSGVVVTTRPSVLLTVARATPTLTTNASRNVAAGTISDVASIAGPAGVATPTGTVTFTVYGPNNATCSGSAFASSTNPVAAGFAVSDAFPASQPGIYRFVASYSGDANYNAVTAPCNAPNESVVVTRRAVADFDGNGTTDRSVYRDGGWYVHGQGTVFFGLEGYVPVPADYDGNGDVERAVFKDGAWYVEGQSTVFFGLPGDIPVPGDYDGDGDAERAVFRPSVGGWYVEGLAPVFLGQAGDVPVPGDYDGDGDVDRAVFREGAWYVEGQAPVFLGLAGFIPVPGDYDGNGTTDRAVFKDGGWYVQDQPTVFFGLPGHEPQPGDYDGDGSTDRAVFDQGSWYTQGQATVFFGLPGDVALPLPHAIRSTLVRR